jgi:hypothetical protein
MRKMKRVMAIMLLAMVVSLCAPQSYAGEMGAPGVGGEIGSPGAGGDMSGPGTTGDMATGIMYPGFAGWIGTGIALLFG